MKRLIIFLIIVIPVISYGEVDEFGRRIEINRTPERIVSMAPSVTEILFRLGLGSKVVGVTDYCNYPKEASLKPKIGGFLLNSL